MNASPWPERPSVYPDDDHDLIDDTFDTVMIGLVVVIFGTAAVLLAPFWVPFWLIGKLVIWAQGPLE